MRRYVAFGPLALLISCSSDGTTGLDYEKIEISSEVSSLVLGESTPVSVTGVVAGGLKLPVLNAAIWSLSPQIADIEVDDQGQSTIVTRAVGTAMLQTAFGPNFELTDDMAASSVRGSTRDAPVVRRKRSALWGPDGPPMSALNRKSRQPRSEMAARFA